MTAATEGLVQWAREHGGILHSAVEIFNSPDTGNAFRVRSDRTLQPGDTIVTCPSILTLSYLNCLPDASTSFGVYQYPPESEGEPSSTLPFPEACVNRIPPHVIGRLLLVREYLLGGESFWYHYIRTLPRPDSFSEWAMLPPFWPSDDAELLEGTNVHAAVPEIKARLKSEFKHASQVLEETGVANWRDYTRVLYNWAYSIFASRSFRPSRVVPGPGSGPLTGRAKLPEGCGIDDFQVLMPLFDVGNHDPTAEVEWVVDDGEGRQGHEKTKAQGLTGLRTVKGYGEGEQVYNHYGDKTNAELLLAYGFIVEERVGCHNDYVHLKLRAAPSSSHSGAAEGGDQPAKDSQKPKEFYFSSKPFADVSSVTGRKKSLLPDVDPAEVISSFRHVQDAMIWELVLMQTSPEDRERLLPVTTLPSSGNGAAGQEDHDRARLLRILKGQVPREFRPILETTIALVQAKAAQELERLEETHFEIDGVEGVTRNQRLAHQYRTGCIQALMNVLESIEMPPEEV